MTELAEWDSFYVIVGSAAGALIGLQFVVMTLIANRPPPRSAEAGRAFSTPTIIHFSTVLLLSALARVPWPGVVPVANFWAFIGLAGAAYTGIVAGRMRRQSDYKPDFEDYLFHIVLPLAAYVLLAISAIVCLAHLREALFGIGAAALLLLFTAIHNAWDATAWHVFAKADAERR
jgi:hypothetical protein